MKNKFNSKSHIIIFKAVTAMIPYQKNRILLNEIKTYFKSAVGAREMYNG